MSVAFCWYAGQTKPSQRNALRTNGKGLVSGWGRAGGRVRSRVRALAAVEAAGSLGAIGLDGGGHDLPAGAEAAELARAEGGVLPQLVLERLRHGRQLHVLALGLALLRLGVLERREQQLGGQSSGCCDGWR